MKRRSILYIVLLSLMFVGCNSKEAATDKKEFYLQTTIEAQNIFFHTFYTYNEKEVITGEIRITYNGLEELTNNDSFNQYRILQSVLTEFEGVEVNIELLEDGYSYTEVWDYTQIDIEEILNADERQNNFIEDNHYSIEKITEYYQLMGFSVNHEKIDK